MQPDVVVGIDDVKYAHLLPVPLTTLRQPCSAIGSAAVSAMMERIAKPDMVARDILLDCELVVWRTFRQRKPYLYSLTQFSYNQYRFVLTSVNNLHRISYRFVKL